LGKVVLIDFWTYSCINCIRTLPYLRDWYNKYHDKNFVIIGVHAPEFEFEKNVNNVKHAIQQYDIKYPVVLDNNYVIWQNYHNQYWPAHYLINKDGQVVYQHFGEGKYDETEHNIRVLLGLTDVAAASSENSTKFNFSQTPETYLGYARAENYAGAPDLAIYTTAYQFPASLPIKGWALSGSWLVDAEKIKSMDENSAIKIHFSAKNVYVVMGSKNNQPIKVTVLLNGKPITQDAAAGIKQSSFIVDRHNLYPIVTLPQAATGVLELQFDKPGAEVYTFTFG
jgi:thiol-disulfide isomerase/thioredoxin